MTIAYKALKKSLPIGVFSATLWLFSTLCDNFCLCKVKCLLGKTFRTILKEETISIDLVSTQKPEEPNFGFLLVSDSLKAYTIFLYWRHNPHSAP